MVRARARRLAGLRHAPARAVHGVAPLVRRHRRLSRPDGRVGPPRRRGRRVRARRRNRRARAGRAPRQAARHADPRRDARAARVVLDRRGLRDRARGRRDLPPVARGPRPDRPLPRRRVQPRDRRRTLPLEPLVRARVGRLPRSLRVRGGIGGAERRRRPGRGVRRASLPRPARPLEPRPLRPAPRRRRERRARARGRRGRAADPAAADRGRRARADPARRDHGRARGGARGVPAETSSIRGCR